MPLEAGARLWRAPHFPLDAIEQELGYLTKIIRSRAGNEQRRALRVRPRRRVRLTHLVARDCLRAVLGDLRAYQPQAWGLPDRTRAIATTTVLANGASQVSVAAAPAWAVVGESVALRAGAAMEMFTLGAVVSNTLTFDETNPAADFPVGTRIMPVDPARLDPALSGSRPRQDLMAVTAVFDLLPGLALHLDPPAAPQSFNGRELWTRAPVKTDVLGEDFLSSLEAVDFGFGRVRHEIPEAFQRETLQIPYRPCDGPTMIEIEDLFRRALGRRGEFYMPTFAADLIPSGVTPMGSGILTVAGTETATAYSGSTVYKALAVQRADGSWEPQTVSSIGPSGNDTVITLGGTWAADVDPATVRRVCWLPVWRFASDSLTTIWRRPGPVKQRAETTLTLQSLEDL